ncbi:hypothetical protein P7K49_024861 [Saguinus oedipus]|uniref:Uncharacterized protein n=1 Tax=Saguinus oedipus TaxID=9490 RepID=A0ABQ9UHS9_SAGOE|nr:hypothetical protein P7K49_024861 [Saguinus oedipus]
MLQAEATALKTLVIMSTPASPNCKLHLHHPYKGLPPAEEHQQCPLLGLVFHCETFPYLGQGGGCDTIDRVPSLEGITYPGQDLFLAAEGVVGGYGPLPGLRSAESLPQL